MLPRLVLAFVLAILPFLSVVAQSLRTETSFTLLVRMSSSTDGMLQIFEDPGDGYRPDRSASTPTQASTTAREYRLPLNAGIHASLRIDPGTGPGVYTIEQVAVLDPSGRTRFTIPLEELAPVFQLRLIERAADKAVFELPPGGSDPMLIYRPHEPLVLFPTDQSVPSLSRRFGLYVAIAFVLLWVMQLAVGRMAPTVSKALEALASEATAHPHIAVLVASILATLIAMYPVIFLARSLVSPNTGGTIMLYVQAPFTPGSSDTVIEDTRGSDMGATMLSFVPFSSVERRALAEGEWPLWNRFNGPGRPLWGQGLSFMMDPLHWLTLLGPDRAPGWDLKFAAHRLVFAWGVGTACLVASGAWLPAAIAASTAPFIGLFVFRLNHPTAFAVTYAPWVLAGWFLIARATTTAQRLGGSLMLAFASAFVLVASPPKDGMVMLAVSEVTGLMALVFHTGVGRAVRRPLACAAAAGLAATMLTTPHWLVFLTTLRSSMTFYDTPGVMFADSGFARALILGPLPDGLPLPGLHALWLVLVAAALVSPALLFRQCGALACLLGAALTMAVAYGAIPASWLMQLPLVKNIISIHLTFQTAALVPLLVLSGTGAAALLGSSRARMVSTTIVVLAVAAWAFTSIGGPAALSRFSTWPILGVLISAALMPMTLATVVRTFPRVLPVTAAVALALLLLAPGGEHVETGIAPLDRVLVQPRPRVPLEQTSPIVDIIHAQKADPGRTLGLGMVLFQGAQALYGLEGVGGPDALFLRTGDELMMATGQRKRATWFLIFDPADIALDAPLFDMMNVKYLLAQYDQAIDIGGAATLLGNDRLAAVPRPTAWPRAFFVDRVGRYESAPDLLTEARRAGRPIAAIQDGDSEAEQLTRDVPSGQGEVAPADRYTLTTNTTTFRVRARRAGIAVLAESYMPDDFIAMMNGKPVPYFRVNHAFKGVVIPGAGEWYVRFEYRPKYWYASLAAGGLGLLVLFGVGVAAIRRPRYSENPAALAAS